MEFKIGDVLLDRFKVMDIRKGNFGIVYICEVDPKPWPWYDMHRQSKATESAGIICAAVKSFQDKYFDKEEVIKDFYHEAEIWVKLGYHTNIVRADIVMFIAGKPHIFLEYVDGGSLRDWINMYEKRLYPDAASAVRAWLNTLSFAIQFCDGMIYTNNKDLGEGKKGIVHRDIKPENIMLTKDDAPILKITDFGLVKALGVPSAERPAGTPEYMSPEQFVTMDVDQCSDIYSFGVVLYEMFFGRRPFPEPENPGLRWEHYRRCHCDMLPVFPTSRKSIDSRFLRFMQRLEQVVSKCLRKNPEDRCQSFEELENEFKEICQDF